MKYHVRDWLNVFIILIFAPFFFGILYMVLSSSVIGAESGMVYLYIIFAAFLWILVNTAVGYTVDKESMTVSFPDAFNLLRRKVCLKGLTCYEILGFDEYAVSDRGVGFRKFKIILKGDFGSVYLIFSREDTARAVYAALKESVPSFGVREGGCLVKN